ncbi:WG repeat-containing protein [Spirochaeta cellobiosiphila]|uniref:WG repeat-containing protein n=1 Tax=Spirochaeta cellobiosiphila TaxID=504483 RepID=UPI00042A929D|nr:WG repeat-containing protein [Spirochaeta cellobiosiphila]
MKMKIFLALVIILFISCSSAQIEDFSDLIIVFNEGHKSVINTDGKIIIKDLEKRLKITLVKYNVDRQIQVVKIDGKQVLIDNQFNVLRDFNYDVIHETREGGLMGRIDKDGHAIKYDLYDKEGNFLYSSKDPIFDYNEGIVLMNYSNGPYEGKFTFIELETGKVIGNEGYYTANAFSEGLAYVYDYNGYSAYINHEGEEVINGWVCDVFADRRMSSTYFSEGLAPIRLGIFEGADKVGYINKKGEIVIPMNFVSDEPFSDGLVAIADKYNHFGYMDKEGNWVIEPQFTSAGKFKDGIAFVNTDGFTYGSVINLAGEMIWVGQKIPKRSY